MKAFVALIGIGIIGVGASMIFGRPALAIAVVVQMMVLVAAIFRWTR